MTNRQAVWVGGGLILAIFIWLEMTLALGYRLPGSAGDRGWIVIMLGGALVGWIVVKVFRIK